MNSETKIRILTSRFVAFFVRLARKISWPISLVLVWACLLVKKIAYASPFAWLKNALLEATTLLDTCMIIANTQNGILQICFKVYKGNYFFGKSVMVVDYEAAKADIPTTRIRDSYFMGCPLLSFDAGVFVANAGPITTSEPSRTVLRDHLDSEIISPEIRNPDFEVIKKDCQAILSDWKSADDMATMLTIRGTVVRLLTRLIGKKDISARESNQVTASYFQRVGEFSIFGYYAPFFVGFLGTRKAIKRDAYSPLQRLGVNNLVIDMVLFAGMFSLGTIVIKCVTFVQEFGIRYSDLSHQQRVNFVIESLRYYPTVAAVHRILQDDETVIVRGRKIKLTIGDQIAYPLVCINRDPKHFSDPDKFDIERSKEEMDKVLSWSTGSHACPVKEFSVILTVLMLDTLAESFDLMNLRISDFEV